MREIRHSLASARCEVRSAKWEFAHLTRPAAALTRRFGARRGQFLILPHGNLRKLLFGVGLMVAVRFLVWLVS